MTLQATPQSLTVVDCVQLSLLDELVPEEVEPVLEALPLADALVAVSVGLFVVCELFGGPSLTGGVSHPGPMHGKWKGGSSGRSGQSKSTSGTSGAFQTISGAQFKHGRMIGTTVVDESEPVVVTHSLPVIDRE